MASDRLLWKKKQALSFFSAILLIVCFPPLEWTWSAWIALVPLLFSVRQCKRPASAFRQGFFTGLFFFGISMHWFLHVHLLAWIFASVIEAFFIGIFAVLVYCLRLSRGSSRVWLRILWLAAAWTLTEVMRSEIPIFGLGWNLLAYSQTQNLVLVQSANAVGAYGLSFAIALINGCIFELVGMLALFVRRGRGGCQEKLSRKNAVAAVLIMAVTLILLVCHGAYHSRREFPSKGALNISLIQGNIPQDLKWDPEVKSKIIEIYKKLSELSAFENPDLIVWPEAAYPGYLNLDPEGGAVQDFVAQTKIPFLIGSPHYESRTVAYNSAYLIGGNGEILQRYDKQYLVPFGEYVPLQPVLGWLRPVAYSLGISDFYAGRDATVFSLPGKNIRFSALICFEDTFSGLARKAAVQGLDFLAVITNDAWFGPTSAAQQHLQASVFRAVESGVPVIRAANTGISAAISPRGEILARVTGRDGKDIFSTGRRTVQLPLTSHRSIYNGGGWVFGYVISALMIVLLLSIVNRSKLVTR